MVTTGALLHGDRARHLDFDPVEHPLALQIGGSEPADLAACARLAARWGYDEVNLNCGCPSERVQRGAFGACLMREAELVRDSVAAMRDACTLPVTVKHRIGIDKIESYEFVRDFVGTVAAGGCNVFIVHARNAVLKGLSPKENREIPPLKYDYVYRLKRELPGLEIVINGGITTDGSIEEHLRHVDGVMLGRAAYHDPWVIADVGNARERVVQAMVLYCRRHPDVPIRSVARHMLGLYHRMPRARLWRRMLSDSTALARNRPELLLEALEAVDAAAAMAV